MNDAIDVFIDLEDRTILAGRAHIDRRRDSTSTAFTYDDDYRGDPAAYPLDPALQLDARSGFVTGLPGAFEDCSPDRWGRRLIEKKIRAAEKGTPRSIGEVDYLLGVSDLTRQGALRFKRAGSRTFESASTDIPKRIQLPKLLAAADRVARHPNLDDRTDLAAVKALLDAGSGSMGGARPKASIVGEDDLLYIAKFPHHNDEWDVMAWEATALDLAARAGITVPRTVLTTVSERSVLLLERFDRDGTGRIGYMSAMTLVQGHDGDPQDYLDLGEELSETSGAADADLADLWRRIAFSVAIHNTDDHLRNHGLLRVRGAWRLSPIFDVNPNPDVAAERVTSILGVTTRQDEVDALLSLAQYFGLRKDRAQSIISEVCRAIADWREVAKSYRIPDAEIQQFEGAFDGLREAFTAAQTSPRGGARAGRGRSTPNTNAGSFKTRERQESDVTLR